MALILKAMPFAECVTRPCGVVDCNSDCGICGFELHTEAAADSDSDCSVDAETWCGKVHYSKK